MQEQSILLMIFIGGLFTMIQILRANYYNSDEIEYVVLDPDNEHETGFKGPKGYRLKIAVATPGYSDTEDLLTFRIILTRRNFFFVKHVIFGDIYLKKSTREVRHHSNNVVLDTEVKTFDILENYNIIIALGNLYIELLEKKS